jgi:hypothetical protein
VAAHAATDRGDDRRFLSSEGAAAVTPARLERALDNAVTSGHIVLIATHARRKWVTGGMGVSLVPGAG